MTPTQYHFTGQFSYESQFGLYDFNARWLDPAIGRFAQADSIVPTQTQGTQAWDRYAFVNNNPVRYTDPSGHMRVENEGGGNNIGCSNPKYCQNGQPKPYEDLKPKPPKNENNCNGLECIYSNFADNDITLPTVMPSEMLPSSPNWEKIAAGIGIIVVVDLLVVAPLIVGLTAFAPELEVAMILTEAWSWPLVGAVVSANAYGWNLIVEGAKGL